MQLGIIGTSRISNEFLQGALLAGFSLSSIYSRHKSSAKDFLEKNNISSAVYTTIDELANCQNTEVVYIASPNSLHFAHAMACLKGGKHILVEKPSFMSADELNQVLEFANKNNLFVLETMRSLYSPASKALRSALSQIGQVQHVHFIWQNYSSKYEAYKSGTNIASTFSKEAGGGALRDIGIYLIYTAIDLFGLPLSVEHHKVMLRTGVDASCTTLFKYKDFNATLVCSKVASNYAPSEIVGEKGSLTIYPLFMRDRIYLNKPSEQTLIFDASKINDMHTQQAALLDIIRTKDTTRLAKAHSYMKESIKILNI